MSCSRSFPSSPTTTSPLPGPAVLMWCMHDLKSDKVAPVSTATAGAAPPACATTSPACMRRGHCGVRCTGAVNQRHALALERPRRPTTSSLGHPQVLCNLLIRADAAQNRSTCNMQQPKVRPQVSLDALHFEQKNGGRALCGTPCANAKEATCSAWEPWVSAGPPCSVTSFMYSSPAPCTCTECPPLSPWCWRLHLTPLCTAILHARSHSTVAGLSMHESVCMRSATALLCRLCRGCM